MLSIQQLFKCLSDDTRLFCLLLVREEGELCVCELTHALAISQPKISRHLALLRTSGLLQDRRSGQWVYYSLSKQLPSWALAIIDNAKSPCAKALNRFQANLSGMKDRPLCCD